MVFRFALGVLIVLTVTRAMAGQPAAEFIAGSTAKLDNPHDLKLSADGRYLFVSDVGNNRVAILDPETLDLIGAFGADHQSGTHDVDVDDEGRVFVADTHNHRVAIYRLEGTEADFDRRVGRGCARSGRCVGSPEWPDLCWRRRIRQCGRLRERRGRQRADWIGAAP